MAVKGDAVKYGPLARALHMVSALLIITLIPLGVVMARIGEGSAKTTLLRVHVCIGLTVFALTLVRVVWSFLDDRPDEPSGLPDWRRRTRKGIHIGIYVTVLVMALSGITLLVGSGAGLNPFSLEPGLINNDLPQRTVHAIVSKLLLLLLVFHVVGVTSAQTRGDVIGRMGIGKGGRG